MADRALRAAVGVGCDLVASGRALHRLRPRLWQLAAGVVLVAGLWITYSGHVRTATWIYEDVRWVDAMTTAPTWTQPRALTRWAWYLTPDPQSSHALSLGLHLVNVALVGLLAWQLGLSGWLAAYVMAWHPLAVEAVAYASARGDLIAALCVLAACLSATVVSLWGLVAAGFWIALGLFAKESAIVGIALVPLIWVRTHDGDRLWVLIGVLTLAVSVWCAAVWTELLGDVHWSMQQIAAAWRWLGHVVVPVHLSPEVLPVAPWLAGTATLATPLLLWRCWSLPAIWIGIVLLPRLLVETPRSLLNDHHMVLALAGIALFLAGWWRPPTAEPDLVTSNQDGAPWWPEDCRPPTGGRAGLVPAAPRLPRRSLGGRLGFAKEIQ